MMEVIANQVAAVLMRKFHCTKRDKKFMGIGLFFPLLATFAVILVDRLLTGSTPQIITTPIQFQGNSRIIPFISDTHLESSNLIQYFPSDFQFVQFNNSAELNAALLNNTNYSDTLGGYYFNINESTHTYNVSVWYNPAYGQSAPYLAKSLYQAIYNYETQESITLSETYVQLPSDEKPVDTFVLYGPLLFEYGFVFMMPYFAVLLVIEKEKQLKHAFLLNSLKRPFYWIGTFIADYTLFMIPAMISLIFCWIFQIKAVSGANAGPAFLLFMVMGLANIPLAYCLSYIFDREETANKWLMSAHSILTAIPISLTTALRTNQTSPWLDLLAIFPAFGLYRGLTMLSIGERVWPIFLVLLAGVVCYWLLLLALEFNMFAKFRRTRPPTLPPLVGLEDEDVVQERARTLSTHDNDTSAISAKEIIKSYDGTLIAVKGISFSIRDGECFCLLGPNGAGKTSLLSVMCGLLDPDSGTIKRKNATQGRKYVQGVCPQFDTLWDLMTGKEHLEVYCRVKGLTAAQTKVAVDESLELFGIAEYATKLTSTYSGGTKRKLCAAIALLADPAVVFMDEPSTGMDPVSRRLMWNVIQQKKEGRALILTTHSMEEAEALSTRVAIMVKGNLRCIGSSQHLRNKYGSGYRITVSCPPENAAKVTSFIIGEFAPTRQENTVASMLHFDVPKEGFSLQKSFSIIESAKEQLGIIDYCVSQTSLEQVFLRFALEQEELDHPTEPSFALGPNPSPNPNPNPNPNRNRPLSNMV